MLRVPNDTSPIQAGSEWYAPASWSGTTWSTLPCRINIQKEVENHGFPGKVIYKCWVLGKHHIYVNLPEGNTSGKSLEMAKLAVPGWSENLTCVLYEYDRYPRLEPQNMRAWIQNVLVCCSKYLSTLGSVLNFHGVIPLALFNMQPWKGNLLFLGTWASQKALVVRGPAITLPRLGLTSEFCGFSPTYSVGKISANVGSTPRQHPTDYQGVPTQQSDVKL